MGVAIHRARTWEHVEFDGFLRDHFHKPFVWGENDCCLFAANGVLAITGVDIAADFRGKYTDLPSALRAIHDIAGGTDVADAISWCAAKYELVEWARDGKPLPLMARRGDLVAVRNDGNTIAGLVELSGRWVAAMGEDGILYLPLTDIVRAWHVPA